MKNLKLILASLVVIMTIVACNKDKQEARMTVRMTDAPADWTAVWVDVKSVQVHYSNNRPGTDGWVTLDTKAGVYDLLKLQNGVSVVLADNTIIPAGKADQMRLILGENNTIVVADVSYKLTIPSAMNTGIKINLNTDLAVSKETIVLLDFDAEKSIVIEGNGSYKLKPVIKVESIIQK